MKEKTQKFTYLHKKHAQINLVIKIKKINYYQPLRKGIVCEKLEGVGRERGMMLKHFSPGLM